MTKDIPNVSFSKIDVLTRVLSDSLNVKYESKSPEK